MYTVTTLESPPLVAATLQGSVTDVELRLLLRDLDERLLDPGWKVRPSLLLEEGEAGHDLAPHQASQVEAFVARTIEAGLRVGRVVATELLAKQLDRLAENAGVSEMIRHFGTRSNAMAWLRQAAA